MNYLNINFQFTVTIQVPLVEKQVCITQLCLQCSSSMCHRQFAERNDDGAKSHDSDFLYFLSSHVYCVPKDILTKNDVRFLPNNFYYLSIIRCLYCVYYVLGQGFQLCASMVKVSSLQLAYLLGREGSKGIGGKRCHFQAV